MWYNSKIKSYEKILDTKLILVAVLNFIAAIIILIMLQDLWLKLEFTTTAASTTGKIIELKKMKGNNDYYFSYYPVVEFKLPDSTSIRFVSYKESNPPKYIEGETVKVLYDISNPYNAMIDSLSLWLSTLMAGFVGFMFIIAGYIAKNINI